MLFRARVAGTFPTHVFGCYSYCYCCFVTDALLPIKRACYTGEGFPGGPRIPPSQPRVHVLRKRKKEKEMLRRSPTQTHTPKTKTQLPARSKETHQGSNNTPLAYKTSLPLCFLSAVRLLFQRRERKKSRCPARKDKVLRLPGTWYTVVSNIASDTLSNGHRIKSRCEPALIAVAGHF